MQTFTVDAYFSDTSGHTAPVKALGYALAVSVATSKPCIPAPSGGCIPPLAAANNMTAGLSPSNSFTSGKSFWHQQHVHPRLPAPTCLPA